MSNVLLGLPLNNLLVFSAGVLLSFLITYIFRKNFYRKVRIYEIFLCSLLIPFAIIVPDFLNLFDQTEFILAVILSFSFSLIAIFLIIYGLLIRFRKLQLHSALALTIVQFVMVGLFLLVVFIYAN